jgi:hypothetical protein
VPPGSPVPAGRQASQVSSALASTPRALQTALGAAAIAGVLTGAVFVGRPPAAAAVLLVQVAVALGWLSLVGTSVGLIDLGIVAAAAVAADVVLLHSREAGPGSLAPVIGVTFVAAILRQLGRRQRSEVTSALLTTASAVALCCAPAVVLPLGLGDTGRAVAASGLLAAAAALAIGALLRAGLLLVLRGTDRDSDRVQAVVGGAAAVVAAAAAVGLSLVVASGVAGGRALGKGDACAVGLVTALAAAVGWIAAVRALPTGRVLGLPALAACLPVLLAAPTAYVVGRIVLS